MDKLSKTGTVLSTSSEFKYFTSFTGHLSWDLRTITFTVKGPIYSANLIHKDFLTILMKVIKNWKEDHCKLSIFKDYMGEFRARKEEWTTIDGQNLVQGVFDFKLTKQSVDLDEITDIEDYENIASVGKMVSDMLRMLDCSIYHGYDIRI